MKSNYQQYTETCQRICADLYAKEAAAKKVADAERLARRIAIQPQLDALAVESSEALKSGNASMQREVGRRIDALLATV